MFINGLRSFKLYSSIVYALARRSIGLGSSVPDNEILKIASINPPVLRC